MKAANGNDNNINTMDMNLADESKCVHNCVMSNGGMLRQFTLTEAAIDDVEALREFEEEGGCHERFFLNMMEELSRLMDDSSDPDSGKKFIAYFNEATYYSRILTSIVNTRR